MAKPEPVREADLVVVGAGPGGYAAAFRAADLGLHTVLIDRRPAPGGVCLHAGCIPSKALLHAAQVIAQAREASLIGIQFEDPRIDLKRLRHWKDSVVETLTGGLQKIARLRGVDSVEGTASFVDGETIRVEGRQRQQIRFRHAILATGSRAASLPATRSEDFLLHSREALQLDSIPERLLIVGGGYIGLEMGTVYATLGSRVTVVEWTAGLLPGVDRDLVRPLRKRLETLFEAIHLNTRADSFQTRDPGVDVTLEGAAEGVKHFDKVLVAVGRTPNTSGLGLELAGVETNQRGFVQVDEECRTTQPRILAVGDVTGEPMLAHKASRQGKIAAEVIAGTAAVFDNLAIPSVVFTDPEIAWCGLTEREAREEGRKVHTTRFPWAASGRALTLGRPDGMTKILFDPEGLQVLGVGIVGPGAGELINEGCLAIEMAAVSEDLASTIHAHPTLSETLMEGAESLMGLATSIYQKPRR